MSEVDISFLFFEIKNFKKTYQLISKKKSIGSNKEQVNEITRLNITTSEYHHLHSLQKTAISYFFIQNNTPLTKNIRSSRHVYNIQLY